MPIEAVLRTRTREGVEVVLSALVDAKVLEDILGRVTHLIAINARWLLDQSGELDATLRDGGRLRIGRRAIAELLD